MSHKVHPKVIKIKGIEDWLSRGFYHRRLPQYLEEDFKIRQALENKLKTASVEDIIIERSQTSLKIIIKTARPALVIGRGGTGVEALSKEIDNLLAKLRKAKKAPKQEVKIEVLELKNPWASAQLVGQWVAQQLEKKVPYRRALKMAISKVRENKEIKGVRIEVAGRLNGIEIARREWLKEGRLPRQTMRSMIDYGFCEARCAYGVIGVKVWLYKGEQFD